MYDTVTFSAFIHKHSLAVLHF